MLQTGVYYLFDEKLRYHEIPLTDRIVFSLNICVNIPVFYFYNRRFSTFE
jgi:hypothetical protein